MAANYMAQFSVNSGTGCCQRSDKNRRYLFGCMFVCERRAVCMGYVVFLFFSLQFLVSHLKMCKSLNIYVTCQSVNCIGPLG